jgi:hypothetical protein
MSYLIDSSQSKLNDTPSREWRIGSVLETIRHFEPDAIEAARLQQKADPEQDGLWPGIGSDWQEVFAQTDLKRTLAEFSSLHELVTASSDVVQGTYAVDSSACR